MKKKTIIEPKNKNLGIELLRFILCLWIVIIHCSKVEKKHQKYFFKGFHVPTFFMLSFYFYYPILYLKKIDKITSRFQRLYFPYLLWPIFILILNNCMIKLTSLGQYQKKLLLKDYYIQILTGSRYHRVFWFQFIIIFLFLIFLWLFNISISFYSNNLFYI